MYSNRHFLSFSIELVAFEKRTENMEKKTEFKRNETKPKKKDERIKLYVMNSEYRHQNLFAVAHVLHLYMYTCGCV